MIEVSIIIPSYKPGKYLYDCLTSLTNQTIDDSLFEVILVLNGPRNPYFEDLNNFISQYPNHLFHLHYVEQNGVSLARNKGLEMAKGKFIGFIDDDDLVSSDYIESMVSLIQPFGIVCSNVKTFREDFDECSDGYISKRYQKIKLKNNQNLMTFRSFMSSACFKLISKEVIKEKNFNQSFGVSEDALFMASISHNIKNIHLAPENTIYFRRVRDDSASRIKKSLKFEFLNTIKLLISYIRIYLSSPFKYNLLFFLNRELAVIKFFIIRIKRHYT